MALESFQTNLIVLAARYPEAELLKMMGYNKPKPQTLERLRNTLQSPHMGLDKALYDFKFNQLEFIRALCDALQINRAEVEQSIAQRKAWLDNVAKAFKPFVWVDTEFTRKSEPIFVLAALEQYRHIRFPDTFHLYSLETQLDLAGERAALYYEQTKGTLLYWGDIKRFRYYVAEDEAYLLDVTGKVIGQHQGPVDNKACGGEVGKIVASSVNRGAPKPGEY